MLENYLGKPGLSLQDNNNLWFTVGERIVVSTWETVDFPKNYTFGDTRTGIVTKNIISLSSSNPNVAEIQNGNVLHCKKAGTTTLRAKLPNGVCSTIKITVKKAKKGAFFLQDNNHYRITKPGKEVVYSYNHTDPIVVIPNTVKLGNKKYKVTGISPKAFGGNPNLREVRIGNNVREIGEWAFFGCKNLTSIVLPASVKRIGNYAFRGCTSLTSITIGSKTPRKMVLGKHAFSNESIRIVHVPKGKRKAYRKLLFAKGLNRKAKVK